MSSFWEQGQGGNIWTPLDQPTPDPVTFGQARLKYTDGVLDGVSDRGGNVVIAANTITPVGAVGNGVVDDTAALQAAINSVPSGGTLELEKGKTYRITSALVVSTNNVTIKGNGALIDGSGIPAATALSQIYALQVSGSITTTWAVDADVAEGSVTVSSTLAAQLAAGDLVLLKSNTEKYPAGTSASNLIGAIHRIRTVDSSTQVTLLEGSFFTYTVAGQARLQKITPVVGVTVTGLRVRMGGVNKAHNGIQLIYAERCVVEKCEVFDTEDTAIQIGFSLGCQVRNNDIYNCLSPGDNSSGVAGNTGYGVNVATAARDCVVAYNRFRNCRHAIAGGGTHPAIGALILANRVDGNRAASYPASASIDCHEDCINWVFEKNYVNGNNASTGTQGILVRGSGTRVINNTVVASGAYGIYVRNYDSSTLSRATVVSGNIIRAPRLGGIVVQGSSSSFQREVIISNNHISGGLDEGIVLYGTNNASIFGNTIREFAAATKSGIRLVGTAASDGNRCKSVSISGNVIDGATHYGIRADYGDGVTICGNVINDCFSHGIYLINCVDVTATGNQTVVTSASVSGIFITASTKVSVGAHSSKNTATPTSQSAGVSISGASSDVSVVGGVFSNHRYGVYSASPANYISVAGINGRGCTVLPVDITASANVAVAANL